MKILFLSELYYPYGGGAEYATYLIAKNLTDAGHDITVITNKFEGDQEESMEHGITVIRRPLLKGTNSIKYSILLKSHVFFQKWFRERIEWADVVYVPRYWYGSIPLIKNWGKPVITHLHDYISICPVANLFDTNTNSVCDRKHGSCSPRCIYSYERLKGNNQAYSLLSSIMNSTIGRYMGWAIKKSDAIICVSQRQKDLIIRSNSDLEQKISVIYNPLPDLQYIPPKNKGLAYFGGPSPIKGFDVLIRSLTQVRKKELKLIATGFKNRNNLNLDAMDSRVEILGWITGEDLERVYSRVHAVIVPSIVAEPAPYVVYEALLRGRLVIGSDIGGIPEQIEGYEGCFLFESGNTHRLSECIEVVESFELEDVKGMGFRNRKRLINKNYNQAIVQSFESIMNTLCGRKI